MIIGILVPRRDEELHKRNIFSMAKSRTTKGAGYAARIGEMINSYKVLFFKRGGRCRSEEVSFKLSLCRLDSSGSKKR